MGEHAVVYGEPALVTAVDSRLRARFESPPSSGGESGNGKPIVVLRLPQLSHEARVAWPEVVEYAAEARARWEAFAASPGAASFARLRGRDPAHLVKVALGESVARLDRVPSRGLCLEVESGLPIGSGFGSSAALASAVAGGCLAWLGQPADSETLESLALEIERRQHGTPSGVDTATVLRGGVLWVERPGGAGVVGRPLPVSAPHLERFRVFDTGRPMEATGAVVAAVRERLDAEPDRLGPILQEMGRMTRRFRDALLRPEHPEELVEPLRRFERGLEALGVVPEPARRLVRAIEASGGAAKISGAGALTGRDDASSGAGSLLAFHPEPERLEQLEPLNRLPRHPIRLGAEGLRIDYEVHEEGEERG